MRYVLLVTAVAVLICAAWTALKRCFCPDERENRVFVVMKLSGHMEDIEFRVRELARKSRGLRGAGILLADYGADCETIEIARRLCAEFDALSLVSSAELLEIMGEAYSAE